MKEQTLIESFSENDLFKLADYASIRKGKDYFDNGNVSTITKVGNHFEGHVNGTYRYNVSLDIKGDALNFYCSCPAENAGICKHCVAFGLALLSGNFSEVQTFDNYPDKDFEKIFREAELQKKLNFLNQLLKKDNNLQGQFISYVSGLVKTHSSISEIDIEIIKNEVFDELSSLDFDSEVVNYSDSEFGYYDDQGGYDVAYELIENVFDTYCIQAIALLKKGNLYDAFNIILGVFEGTQGLPEPHDEYCLFDEGFEVKIMEYFSNSLKEFSDELESVVKSDEATFQVIDLYFERFAKYEQLKSNNENLVKYNLKLFQNVFISLIQSPETANHFLEKLNDCDLENLSSAYIVLKIAELTSNQTLWIETAECFAEFELPITQQLLSKYKALNDNANFNRVALLAFNKWPNETDLYLLQNINKESNEELYLNALKYYVKEKRNIAYYKELRILLNESDLNLFINGVSNSYSLEFYVQMLEVEGRFHDILQCAIKHKDSFSFENLIKPIVHIYPQECFAIIEEKCRTALGSRKRDRDTYQYMVKLLLTLQNVKEAHVSLHTFAKSLFNNKPNLPALKDELKKAKLV